MALFAFNVLWENVTSLQKGSKFWESWEGTQYPKTSDTLDQGLDNPKLDNLDVSDVDKALP